MTSMLEYLASLRQHDHAPLQLGEVHLGKTLYIAGMFMTPERDAPPGSKLAQAGLRVPSEPQMVFMPCFRSDRPALTAEQLPLLPRIYRRAPRKTLFVTNDMQLWFISGWHDQERVFWMKLAPTQFLEDHPHLVRLYIAWKETFDNAMSLAGKEVLARIEAAEQDAQQGGKLL